MTGGGTATGGCATRPGRLGGSAWPKQMRAAWARSASAGWPSARARSNVATASPQAADLSGSWLPCAAVPASWPASRRARAMARMARPARIVRQTRPARGARTVGCRRQTGFVMKIATFNVNGIKTRQAHLLQWLDRERPDVACLQELKALDASFPAAALREAGYHALWKGQQSWNGVAILTRDGVAVETRRELPGGADDTQSRYLEAAVDGVLICCLYLPNGNPQPGPKFDYKLQWFERLIKHAADLYLTGKAVVLAGDYNVVP